MPSVIVDGTGTKVVEYGYDGWGKPSKVWSLTHSSESTLTSAYAKLAQLNPFRYRGYVWDEETGLYYLRSRYYDPAWGRFIIMDALGGRVGNVGEHNLYTYCMGSPVNHADRTGAKMEAAFGVGMFLLLQLLFRSHIAHEITSMASKIQMIWRRQKEKWSVPTETNADVYRHLWVNGYTDLFHFRNGPNNFVYYVKDNYGCIRRCTYAYKTYDLGFSIADVIEGSAGLAKIANDSGVFTWSQLVEFVLEMLTCELIDIPWPEFMEDSKDTILMLTSNEVILAQRAKQIAEQLPPNVKAKIISILELKNTFENQRRAQDK